MRFPIQFAFTKSKLLKHGELERATRLAALNAGVNGGILVLLDSDEDCPAQLGPELLGRVRLVRPDVPSTVVLARREFESWFLASAESLRGCRGLPGALKSPDHPEEISGAKEWLTSHIRDGAYASTVDQASLTNALDFGLARRAASFDKCYREIKLMLEMLCLRGEIYSAFEIGLCAPALEEFGRRMKS